MSTGSQGTCLPPITTTATTSSSPVLTQTESHPKASYEEVVADERVFVETLEDLHNSLGTKFMVPTIGGRPLDLHRLFVEVTCRGGLQKVIGDRKWKDVTSAFAFPSTATSASFLLRKYYISLLQTYEQVYFRKRDSELPSNEHPSSRVGSLVNGKINGKFESGYIVTANFGSEVLNGVLYHVPPRSQEPHNLPLVSHKRDQKRSRREKDTSNLKSNMAGYNIFFAEHYSKLRPIYSGKEKAIVKNINSLWNNLSVSEKEVYQERDNERRKTCMLEYERS